VLVGGASSLINVLDKCLVDGYGSKAAAGWTKPFTGTNLAAFRNSVAAGGSGMYLRVSDNASLTGGARNAAVRAYLTMSSISVGTIATPTTAQLTNGIVWRKSDTTDSTARPWLLVADELTFYLCVDTGTLADEGGAGTYAAGDFASYVPGDAYRFFVAGRETAHVAGEQGVWFGLMARLQVAWTQPTDGGMWIGRGHAGTGDAVRAAIPTLASHATDGIGATGDSQLSYSAPGSGLQMWTPAFIAAEATLRGRLRGLYAPLNTFAGVAIGTDVVNPPGITGTITTLRHNSFSNNNPPSTDCHMHVDSTNEWPL
jgi:hypothetical protein